MKNIMSMKYLKMPDGEPIEHPMVTRVLESSQRKVEGHNFDMRKQLLEYDDVSNDQRHHIYQLRNAVMDAVDVAEHVKSLRDGMVSELFHAHIPEESVEEQWDVPGLEKTLQAELLLHVPLQSWIEAEPAGGGSDDAPLAESQVAQWRTAGAVVVDQLLPIELILEARRQAVDTFIAAAARGPVDFGSGGTFVFPSDCTELNDITLHPRLLAAVAQLLGCRVRDLRLSQSDLWAKHGKAKPVDDPVDLAFELARGAIHSVSSCAGNRGFAPWPGRGFRVHE
jgi:hypothetical protein